MIQSKMCIAQVSSEDEIESEDIPPSDGVVLILLGAGSTVLYYVRPGLLCVFGQLGPSGDQLTVLSTICMVIDRSSINM